MAYHTIITSTTININIIIVHTKIYMYVQNIHPRILNVPGSRQNKISPSVKCNKMRYKFNELTLEQQTFVNLILPEWFK
jgi:hypothetical protein